MEPIERDLNELENLVFSVIDFHSRKDYDSAICALEDLIEIAGNKLIPAIEELEDSNAL